MKKPGKRLTNILVITTTNESGKIKNGSVEIQEPLWSMIIQDLLGGLQSVSGVWGSVH